MTLTIDNIILLGSILLFVGILSTRTTRYGIPVLLLFLIVGMLAGSDGIGGIYFYDPRMARFIGVIALCFILFSGGLETRWNDIRPVLWHGVALSSLGVVITAVVVGVMVSVFTKLPLIEGLLLGSIVSSTDAAAVFSILRSRSLALKGNLRPMLELESGSNDPMAYFLTILFTYILTHRNAPALTLVTLFFQQMAVGAVAGYLMGMIMHRIINWIRLEYDGLYSVLLITLMLFTYSATDFLGGNGFLAVYVSACILGNRDFIHKKSLIRHFDGQAWLMQGIMFITLGLLVFPLQLIPFIGIGLLISVILIFLARPLSVYISLAFFRISNRKKLFISWVGLRGAVPIVLATFPLTAGIDKANIIFNIVFFISIASILLQGTTLPAVARWLGLTLPAEIKKSSVLDKELKPKVKSLMVQVVIEPACTQIGKSVVDLHLGTGITIISVQRKGKYFTPDGSTKIQPGDRLSVVADDEKAIGSLYRTLGLEASS